jgi:hypothetical protein
LAKGACLSHQSLENTAIESLSWKRQKCHLARIKEIHEAEKEDLSYGPPVTNWSNHCKGLYLKKFKFDFVES